jgi:SAM-dependent methyltransferase
VSSQVRIAETRRRAFAIISNVLHRYKHAGACLDVGCNTGELFDQFDSRAWRRYGIEPDSELAGYAAMTHGATVHAGTLDDAEFHNGGFEVVTMIDTICLAPDPLAALTRIRALLAPGGVLAVEFPGQAYMLRRSVGPINYLLDGRWSRLRTDGNHLYFFTAKGMQQLLSMAGFRVLAWIPIPSPSQPGAGELPIRLYYSMTRLIASCCSRVLDFCPKLLCIASRA